jgi:[acyl-carrier-protein] S-malonyltransferase
VGPEPNLIPSTYERIALDVSTQIGKNFMGKLGRRFMSGLAQRQWLIYLLTKDAALLRAPFIEHIILEDWLLANAPK